MSRSTSAECAQRRFNVQQQQFVQQRVSRRSDLRAADDSPQSDYVTIQTQADEPSCSPQLARNSSDLHVSSRQNRLQRGQSEQKRSRNVVGKRFIGAFPPDFFSAQSSERGYSQRASSSAAAPQKIVSHSNSPQKQQAEEQSIKAEARLSTQESICSPQLQQEQSTVFPINREKWLEEDASVTRKPLLVMHRAFDEPKSVNATTDLTEAEISNESAHTPIFTTKKALSSEQPSNGLQDAPRVKVKKLSPIKVYRNTQVQSAKRLRNEIDQDFSASPLKASPGIHATNNQLSVISQTARKKVQSATRQRSISYQQEAFTVRVQQLAENNKNCGNDYYRITEESNQLTQSEQMIDFDEENTHEHRSDMLPPITIRQSVVGGSNEMVLGNLSFAVQRNNSAVQRNSSAVQRQLQVQNIALQDLLKFNYQSGQVQQLQQKIQKVFNQNFVAKTNSKSKATGKPPKSISPQKGNSSQQAQLSARVQVQISQQQHQQQQQQQYQQQWLPQNQNFFNFSFSDRHQFNRLRENDSRNTSLAQQNNESIVRDKFQYNIPVTAVQPKYHVSSQQVRQKAKSSHVEYSNFSAQKC